MDVRQLTTAYRHLVFWFVTDLVIEVIGVLAPAMKDLLVLPGLAATAALAYSAYRTASLIGSRMGILWALAMVVPVVKYLTLVGLGVRVRSVYRAAGRVTGLPRPGVTPGAEVSTRAGSTSARNSSRPEQEAARAPSERLSSTALPRRSAQPTAEDPAVTAKGLPAAMPDQRALWKERKLEFSDLSPRLQELGELVARVAAAGSQGDVDVFRQEARRAAGAIRPEELRQLPMFFHANPPQPAETTFDTPRFFGVWMSACQGAVVEIAAQMGDGGLAWLRELAFSPYDWPQVDAAIRLMDLVEEGEYPVSYLIEVTARLENWRDSQFDAVLERLETWKGPLPEEALEYLEAFCVTESLELARICRQTRPDLVRPYAAKMIAARRAADRPLGSGIDGEDLVDLLEWFPEEIEWIEAEMKALVERARERGAPHFQDSLLAIARVRPDYLEPMVPILTEWARHDSGTPGTDKLRNVEIYRSLEILCTLEPPGLDLPGLITSSQARFKSGYYRKACEELLQGC